jgi:hypothetical protein
VSGVGNAPNLEATPLSGRSGLHADESGLLVMPQAIAAMSMKMTMPRRLSRVGYRGVLISNTLILGILLMVFATIGLRTPDWVILLRSEFRAAIAYIRSGSATIVIFPTK